MAKMTNAQLGKWGERYGITVKDIKDLRRLINRRAKQEEHASNGDPHPRLSDFSDKNANAAEWSKESDATGGLFKGLVKALGFDGINFGVGLYPALVKGDDTCIMVPE